MIKKVTSPQEIKKSSLAVMVFETHSIYHEGDERSRTNPGHGYPPHWETINTVNYYQFDNEDELKAWIASNKNKNNYVVISAQKLEVKQEIKISIG